LAEVNRDFYLRGLRLEPLRLLRITVGALLLFGTAVAVALAVAGVEPRALQLVGVFWAIYGLVAGFTGGVLEPVIEGVAHVLTNLGLTRAGGGFSGIETLVVRGDYETAAEAYRERARRSGDRVEATLRRAALLAGPLRQPETALVELEGLRRWGLSPAEDVRVGVALVDLHERTLGDPGRAMAELRRLLDLHPDHASVRRLRRALADLKDRHVASEPV
jgi:hypothetical protein